MADKLKICYFGFYDPQYNRNRVLLDGLRLQGIDVIEINEQNLSSFKYFRLIRKYFKTRKDFDVMIVGFPGQEVMFLARLLTRKPIIFDAFTSHYGGYILDRQYFSKTGWRAKYYRFLDTWSCRLADVILLDTQAHIDFFIAEFGLSPEKFKRVWVGADTDIFHPSPAPDNHGTLSVLFFGTYIPLQGVEYIIRAAKLLEREDVAFTLIGTGQDKNKVDALAHKLELKNILFKGKMTLQELNQEIEESDVCLGIFGETLKTQLVIPNKVYQAVAALRPVITADTLAVRELFDEGDMCFVKAADPESLAAGIKTLIHARDLRNTMAAHAYHTFTAHASVSAIGQRMHQIISEIL